MSSIDVVGIGNALVDVIVHVDESDLADFELEKSVMHPINARHSQKILEKLKGHDTTLASGGSIANSLSGISSFGNKTVFVGSVGNDEFADKFVRDLKLYDVEPRVKGDTNHPTGHSIIFITPDGERTFATHTGAAAYLTPANINASVIKSAKILYIEGYVLALPSARDAAIRAAEIAHENNVTVAIDMSNISIVEEFKEELDTIIKEYAQIVFANSAEATAYTGKEVREALLELSQKADVVAITLHDKGSVISAHGTTYQVSPVHVKNVVSTNGAGDMYSAGILHGILNDMSFDKSGQIASFFAARAVEIDGARLAPGFVQEELAKGIGI